jgi:membrane protease YdiL (CAAX protease family)
MTNLPEDDASAPATKPADDSEAFFQRPEAETREENLVAEDRADDARPFAAVEAPIATNAPSPVEPPLFQSYAQPTVRRFVRIPNFGHLLLLSLLITVAFAIATAIVAADYVLVTHFNHSAAQSFKNLSTNLGFNLSFEAILYLVTFGFSLFVFPMVWNESLFAGLQWRGTVALSKFWRLAATALGCFGLAILDQALMPGPANSPIEKMISSPSAAWLMFAFGVTMAPFFEEMFFRGFILPSLCTACDWIAEKMQHTLPRPLDASGHPRWSLPAMIIGSVLTSLPFAGLHVDQQGHSLGPFLLLIAVSLILCTVRLRFRSLAASTLVHASYNLLIFSVELIATGGFRHFDKM